MEKLLQPREDRLGALQAQDGGLFEGVGPRQRPLSGSRCQDSPTPRRLPAVLVAWHDSGPDFSVHVGGRLRCLNLFPREDPSVTSTMSRLHCKMGTLSASVE